MPKNTMKESVEQLEKNVQQYKTENDLLEHAQNMCALYIGLMQGIAGKQFTDGFLEGALEDENRIVVKPEKLQ